MPRRGNHGDEPAVILGPHVPLRVGRFRAAGHDLTAWGSVERVVQDCGKALITDTAQGSTVSEHIAPYVDEAREASAMLGENHAPGRPWMLHGAF